MKENLNRMLTKSKKWFILLVLGLISIGAFAQEITVSGKVVSTEDGMPIPGVSIIIKGTTNGTITNVDGIYSIVAGKGQVLQFNFVGMADQEITINDSKIDVRMEPEAIGLNEVVAIGYGTQKKKELTGAVVQVKSETLTQMATADIGTALQGQVAGVNVQASSGAPGASSNIQIRGVNSINGANAPLFVVDGIPQDSDPRLSSNEIETIDILKDAASAAIYGTRGSGGVILITTKRGKAGTMQISADSYYGVQKITSGMPLMNFEEQMYEYFTWQRNNNGLHSDNTWTQLESNPNNFTNNSNLMDVIQQDNASIQNHSVNVSGGSKDLTYNVVGSYFSQEGTLINTHYDRFNIRSNTSYKKGRWSVTTGLGFRVEEQAYAPWQLLLEAYKYKPFQQDIDPNVEIIDGAGGNGSNEARNLGQITAKLKQSDVRNGEQFNGNAQVRFEIMKGFELNTRVGVSYNNNTRILINPLFEVYDDDGDIVVNSQTRSRARNTSDRSTSFTWESGINWERDFGDHNVKILGVVSNEKYTFSSFWGEKWDLVNNDITVINGGTADPNAGSGEGDWGQDRVNTLIGLLGRVQYNYKGRYLLSVSARHDGSSRFGAENRWGTFPSASVGWNVSDEPFWANLRDVANSFKLRASYGTTGNQNFADYRFSPTIRLGYDYPFGTESNGKLALGGIQTGYANPEVKWETSIQRNIGLDFGFLSNRLTFSADFYNTDKKDMLFPLLLPTSTGAGQDATVILNVGDMNNKGMEFAIGYRNSGKVRWGVSATYSKNVNEITKMSGSSEISYFSNGTAVDGVNGNDDRITAIKKGYEAGAFFVMETNGLANTEAKLAEYQKIVPTAAMGDLIYVDNSGDGIIDEKDRVYGGSGAPDFELGLNANVSYKGFDASMQWYASVGNDVINGSRIYSYLYGTHKDLLSQYSSANQLAPIAPRRTGSHLNYRGWADVWVEDASFVRLRNFTIGYTFPKRIVGNAGIGKLRVYLATDNPLTFTKYQGYDPEVGNDGLATRGLDKGNYPISSQYRAGIQLNF